MKLATFEKEFLRAVRFDRTPESLLAAVEGGGSLTAGTGMGVYRRMLWYRLVDAHVALFPRTARALGGRRFVQEVCACLAERPSRVPVLERLAGPFAEWVTGRDVPGHVKDFARLEAAGLASLLAPDPTEPLLSRDTMRTHDVLGLTLRGVPSLQVVRASASAYAAFGRLPVADDVEEDPVHVALPASDTEVGVLFVRPGFVVVDRRLADDERVPFDAALSPRGLPMGELLDALAGPEADATRAFRRLSDLIDLGLFTTSKATP